jgi:RNA 2',3'-cyclic 3'-phosphodiesterase
MNALSQLSLFANRGKAPRPIRITPRRGLDPVFFAVMIGADRRPELQAIVTEQQRRYGVSASLLPAETLHISLVGVGFYQQLTGDDLAVAVETGDSIGFTPFDIAFTRLMSFARRSGPPPLVLSPGSDTPLVDLSRLLRWGMLERGFEPRSAPTEAFHLTLLYDAVGVPETPLERPPTLRIDGFALVRSVYGQGPYEIIGEWPRERADMMASHASG